MDDKHSSARNAPKKSPRGRPEGPVPHYQKVVDDLRQRLNRGEWRSGDAMPSFRQFAAEYAVGLRVIRSALDVLKQEDRIEINARKRVTVKSQGFLCTAINRAVAVVLSNRLDMQIKDPDSCEVLKGIQAGVGKRCDPLLMVHDFRRTRDRIPPDLIDLPLSGILLYGSFMPETLEAYSQLRLPVVLVDRPQSTYALSSVCVDNFAAAKDATARLLAMGHRRIAFMRFVLLSIKDIDPDSKEREAGYRAAFAEASCGVPEGSVFNYFTKDKASSGAFHGLFRHKPAFSAVVCADPNAAKLCVEAAQERGISIPRQLSITCFHSKAQAATNWSGPRIEFEPLGLKSVELLKEPKIVRCERVQALWHEGITVAQPGVIPGLKTS